MSQTALPPGLRARVLAEAARTKPASTPYAGRIALLAALAASWVEAIFVLKGVRRDFPELPAWYGLGTLAVLGAAAAVVSVVALSRGRHMLGARAEALVLAAAAIPVIVGVWATTAVTSVATSAPVPTWQVAMGHAPACDVLSLVLSLPMLGVLLWMRRGLIVPSPATTGACLGAAAALWAHAAVFTMCPYGHSAHAFAGHVVPMLPVIVLGAWAGRRGL